MHLNFLIQRFMFEYELNSKIIAVDSVSQAVENATVCILAIPTQMVNNTLHDTFLIVLITLCIVIENHSAILCMLH